MNNDQSKDRPLTLFERSVAVAMAVLLWAVVICAVLSMGRCTYDLVSGAKQLDDTPVRDGGKFFRDRAQ